MKKRKLATFLLLFTSVFFSLKAQDEIAFKVLVNKGKSEIKSGSKVQAVKVGSTLKPTDELNVPANSYLGLVHVNGKPLEIKDAGKYKVETLAQKVSGNSSVLNKYTDFILSSNSTKKNTLVATGAVHRGMEFAVYLPGKDKNPVVFGNEVVIHWNTEKDKKITPPYIVLLTSMFGDELAKLETTDTKIKINLADANLADEDNIVVRVYQKANPNAKSDDFTLKRLSSADKDRIKAEFSKVSTELSTKNALDKYLEAAFFEENGLLIDATTAFMKAVELEPTFKTDYEDYLLRTGLKEPPAKDK